MIMCERCKVKESTGFFILLCDECFEKYQAEGKHDISVMDPSMVRQDAGGLAPNDAKGVKIRYNDGDPVLDYVK
jgi:hypothetical protein